MKHAYAGRVYEKLTIEEFEARVAAFKWRRKIVAFHLHHTADRHAAWNGVAGVHSTWKGHTQTRGMQDLAMHALVDPHGGIWLGRDWNLPPASARGHNGNGAQGPFMIECWGDFRSFVAKGKPGDPWAFPQSTVAERIAAAVCKRFELNPLDPDTIIAHKEVDKTACPGDIDMDEFEAHVADYLRADGVEVAAGAALPAEIKPDEQPPSEITKQADKGSVVAIATAASAGAGGVASLFKAVPQWASGGLLLMAGAAGLALLFYFLFIKRRREAMRAAGIA